MGEPTSEQKKSPIAKFRAGAMSTSVWENTGSKDGNDFSFKTITLQRSYKNKEDKWVNESITIRKNDVANLRLVLDKAHEVVAMADEKESTDSE